MKTRLRIAILAALVSALLVSAPAYAVDRSSPEPFHPDMAGIVDDPDPSGFRYGREQVGPDGIGHRETKGHEQARARRTVRSAAPDTWITVLEIRTPDGVRRVIFVAPFPIAP